MGTPGSGVQDSEGSAGAPRASPPVEPEVGVAPTGTVPRGDPPRRLWFPGVLAAGLLAAYVALAVSAISQKCATWDESAYIAGGYSYWLRNDYRLNAESGHLSQRWDTLPLLTGRYLFPGVQVPGWRTGDAWDVGNRFLYTIGNDADAILFRGRLAAALLSAGVGVVVFLWSRRLFGPIGALLSLALFAFCPTMLGNGPVIQSDMAAALGFTAATAGVWAVLHRVSPGRVMRSCVALALLFLAKMTAVIFIPIAAILVLVRLAAGHPLEIGRGRGWNIRSRGRQTVVIAGLALVHALIVWAAVWAAFGFRFAQRNDPPAVRAAGNDWRDDSRLGGAGPFLRAAYQHRLLPEAYLRGLAFQVNAVNGEQGTFLNGEFRPAGGFFWFFPYCMLVKTPLPLFGLLGLAAWTLVRGWTQGGRRDPVPKPVRPYALTPLVVLPAVYWAAVLARAPDLGHRYLIPTYPPLFILAGALAGWLPPRPRGAEGSEISGRRRRVRWPVVATGILLAALVGEALATWPNYLAYFNWVAGGPRHGYRRLVESSLDWGQDLPGLRRWLDAHHLPSRNTPVYLAYSGMASVKYYAIRAQPLGSDPPQTWPAPGAAQRPGGVFCISATLLQTFAPAPPGQAPPAREVSDRNDRGQRQVPREVGAAPAGWHTISPRAREGALARLFALLRAREPDDQVGYSILIYHVSDDDAERCLSGEDHGQYFR